MSRGGLYILYNLTCGSKVPGDGYINNLICVSLVPKCRVVRHIHTLTCGPLVLRCHVCVIYILFPVARWFSWGMWWALYNLTCVSLVPKYCVVDYIHNLTRVSLVG